MQRGVFAARHPRMLACMFVHVAVSPTVPLHPSAAARADGGWPPEASGEPGQRVHSGEAAGGAPLPAAAGATAGAGGAAAPSSPGLPGLQGAACTPQTGWLAEQARKPAPVGHICLLTCRRRRCHPPLVILCPQVWLPGDAMEDGETLQYDPTAYDCMSSMSLDWPSLSFDLLRDHLGAPRAAFPHTLFMVAGTQASSAKSNYLAVMKVSGLAAGKHVAARQKEQQREREQGGQQGGQQGQQHHERQGQKEGSDSDDEMDVIAGSDEDSDAGEGRWLAGPGWQSGCLPVSRWPPPRHANGVCTHTHTHTHVGPWCAPPLHNVL